MTGVQKELKALADEKYREFTSRLIPEIDKNLIIGVRVPDLRKFASEFAKTPAAARFTESLPHKYHEENLLNALLINRYRNFDEAVAAVDGFLPFVDNWAVCDSLSPAVFRKEPAALLGKINEWCSSGETYTVRFGIKMLMTHFLDGNFKPEYNEIPAGVISGEYYINMMIAWYYATALAKQWEASIPYIEGKRLPEFVHRMTIRKACESFRITPEQKAYLRTLR